MNHSIEFSMFLANKTLHEMVDMKVVEVLRPSRAES